MFKYRTPKRLLRSKILAKIIIESIWIVIDKVGDITQPLDKFKK